MEKGLHYIVLVSMVRALCMLKKGRILFKLSKLDCCRLDL